ncbi:MAG: LysR family transcriptional regulator [Blastocatellia bacterium]|nr:LysR family transcriptional regulator [Blastocatellia bacterium]
MELTPLRTFRMVAETLNFTRAAERLGLTQSAVSHQILGLESELGEPLFIRTKRGVKLSPAGAVVLEYAERILREEQALKEKIGGPESAPTGRVRVAAATQALVYLFAPLFEQFMRAFPQVELTFHTTPSTDQTIADIFNGRADVGFASLPVSAPSLQVAKLFEDELMLVVSHTHRLVAKKEVSLKEIQRERLILFERGASIRRATDQFFDKVGIKPDLALESNDTYFIKLMVEHGWGMTLLPAWAVREEVAAGKLAKLKIAGHRLRRNVDMVSLGRFQPSGTRAFTTFIQGHAVKLQEMAKG